MTDETWIKVPKKLTFGMRVALEEAIIRHERDPDKIYQEVLDFAPAAPLDRPGEG
ncbi:hypothetical protein [Mesorhizobium sp. B2-1-2]|uniref:hypothetical protein n=1 Tax=Mesorhizobium sp. B2-1-2 TaxID=2589973 RepID=UPI001745D5A2|nr:hypothetical protein [Mesorhizobium sp. B2-1-2]